MRTPISVRTGMFCKLGESLERRPVAARVCCRVLCMRPSSEMSLESFYIGAPELGQLTVLDDAVGYGILYGKLLQHLRVGGVAGLGLPDGGNAHLFEEDLAELLG